MGGAPADKPARLVGADQPVHLAGPGPRYVGRGGEKLEGALAHFRIDVSGLDALDAGASTGGFTDCLLQAGARRVVAVDVGRGQLHDRLRRDPRVEAHERTDIRAYATDERFPVVVADLSFISVRTVAAALVALVGDGGDLVVLVKPQFEAGREEASRARGVIREPEIWRRTVTDAISAIEAAGATNMGVMVSPLRGADGNVEFLAHFRRPPAGAPGPVATGLHPVGLAVARAVDGAVGAALDAAATAAGRGSGPGEP